MRLAQIRRYPVKGFRGHDLDSARFESGRGIPFDRHLALLLPPLPDVANTDRGTLPYLYLSRNPELARFSVDWDGGEKFVFRSPDGGGVAIDTGSASDLDDLNRALARWFPDREGGAPRVALARPDGGYWDFSDTGVSVINLATVREIARTAGRPIDPNRFRGNLYIDGRRRGGNSSSSAGELEWDRRNSTCCAASAAAMRRRSTLRPKWLISTCRRTCARPTATSIAASTRA